MAAWTVLCAVCAGAFIAGVANGSSFMPLDRVIGALFGHGQRTDQIIVWNLRLPRVVLAALAGAALGVAGALLQRATRNPLAEPTVIGIVGGAAVGVLSFLWFFSDEANALTVSIYWQPLAAVLGAAAFSALTGYLAVSDGASPMRLLLYGVAVAALANAVTVLMIIAGPVYRASSALIWLAGSVHEAEWRDVLVLATIVAAACPLVVAMLSALDQLRLDDGSAAATGLAVNPARLSAVLLSVVLTAAAVSVVGGVGFVGLMAPHAARLLFGTGSGRHLLSTAAIGASIVMAADLIVRIAFQPLEVPTGAMTALIGAPYFVFILIRQGRAHA